MLNRSNYYKKLEPFIGKPVIKIISGMRRIGKSTFLKLLKERFKDQGVPQENLIYISKELIKFDFLKGYMDLHQYVEKIKPDNNQAVYLLIDEVQEIEGWEKAINSFLAEGGYDIYLTGSNSRMLSSELATLITGRYVVLSMHPLSFKEFIRFRKEYGGDGVSSDHEVLFAEYLRYGGLPGIHHFDLEDDVVFKYVNSIYNTIVLKDIVARYQVRDVLLMERIIKFIFDNCGCITSVKKVSDFLKSQQIKIGVQTVHNYISYLQNTFLIHKVDRYDLKGKRLLEIHEKYYANDTGIRHSLLSYRHDDIAQILENVVYLELIRRGYEVNIGKLNNLEVDFVARKQERKLYVQVSYLLASPETEEREFRSLEKIKDNHPKMVLTMDRIWGGEREGIERKNIIDFLLED